MVYATDDQLERFAENLVGFPLRGEDERVFQLATSEQGNRVAFRFRSVDRLGHCLAIVAVYETEQTRESAVVAVPVEAAGIDVFIQQLRSIAKNRAGSASLVGITSSVGADAHHI